MGFSLGCQEVSRRRWFGYRVHSPAPITNVFIEFDATFDMNFTNMHDGDTIVRTLFGYRLETVLVDNNDGLQRAPWPWQIGLTYTPTPDGELTFDPGSVGGDALFRDFARWHPYHWTDGTLHATKWYADSGGMQSIQAQRTVVDKTEAALHLIARGPVGDPGFEGDLTYVYGDLQIMMWVEILVQTNF